MLIIQSGQGGKIKCQITTGQPVLNVVLTPKIMYEYIPAGRRNVSRQR